MEKNIWEHIGNTIIKTQEGFVEKGTPKMRFVVLVH